MRKIILIFITVFTQVWAQNSADSLKSGDKRVQAALEYYNRQDYEQAKVMLDTIIEEENNNAEAHFYRAWALFQLENLDEAIESCETAVELDENNAEYHFNLARLYGQRAGDAGIFKLPSLGHKIRKEAETAVELDPNHIGARLLLGYFHFQAPGLFGGNNKKAIEHAKIAVQLDAWQGRLLLIRIYNKMKEYDRAENECRLLERMESGDEELQLSLFYLYGQLLEEQNRIDEAVEKYREAVILAPDKSWTHNVLGNAYLLKEQYSEALDEFNKALVINPQSGYAKGKIEEINKKNE